MGVGGVVTQGGGRKATLPWAIFSLPLWGAAGQFNQRLEARPRALCNCTGSDSSVVSCQRSVGRKSEVSGRKDFRKISED